MAYYAFKIPDNIRLSACIILIYPFFVLRRVRKAERIQQMHFSMLICAGQWLRYAWLMQERMQN